jgi:uncharacterized protein YidB (DUF937 family)
MGLLDSIAQIAGQAMSSGNGQGTLLEGVVGMIAGHEGGLAGLVEAFRSKGLGDVAASWVGTGENLPVSGEQVSQVLGGDTMAALAGKFGLSQEELSGKLSQLLPQVVDRLTPGGEIGQGQDAAGALGMLKGLLGK